MSAPPEPTGTPGGSGADEPPVDPQRSAAARNTVALLLSRVAVAAMGWAGSIVVARLLSVEEWGQYSFVFGLLGILSVITDLGVGRVVLSRLVDPEDAADVPFIAGSFIALRVLLGLVGYVAAVAYVLLLPHPDAVVRATVLAGLVVVIATPSQALTLLFQSRLRLTVVAAAEAVGQVVQLALTILAAIFAPLLLVFVLPVIANELVKITLKLRGVRRGDAGPRPARQVQAWRWRRMLVEAIPLAIGTALATLLYKIDVLMLSRLDTFESVGLYTVGYKFADVLALVSSAVLAPGLTLLVAAWPKDTSTFRARAREASLVLGMLAAVTLAGFWVAARPVITLLYGDRFGAAAGSTQLLVAGACLAMLTQVGFTLLVATGRQRVYPYVGLVGLALNVGLNLWLIPRMSFRGAAVATVATEVVVFVVMWLLVLRTVPVRGLLPARQLLALGGATVAVVLAGDAVADLVPWPVLSAASGLAVLAVAWVLRLPGTRTAAPALAHRLRRSSS